MKKPDDKDHHHSKRKRCDDDEDLSLQISDKTVLDCPICFHPLTIPVFQCLNGHVSCSSCHRRLKRKCPVCSGKLSNLRNLAIENVITCPYKAFGCNAQVNYSAKHSHQEKCTYASFRCPFYKDCKFMGYPNDLYLHLKQNHGSSVITIGRSFFSFSMSKADEFAVFLKEGDDESDGTMYILSRKTMEVLHIQASELNSNLAPEFTCSINVDNNKMGSFWCEPVKRPWPRANDATCHRAAVRTADSKQLQIINHFYYENGVIKMWVCIR